MRNIKFIVYILVIVLLSFSFTACNTLKTSKEWSALTINETTVEVTTTTKGATTTTIAETTTTINNDIGLFKEAIKEYDPISSGKALDYARENYQITVDAVDKKITEKEVVNRYMALANKVSKDYFDLVIQKEKILDKSGIQNITPEMKQMISLLIDWSDKTETIYEYAAKYCQGEGGEFKIKADELQNETDKISDEYNKLYNEK